MDEVILRGAAAFRERVMVVDGCSDNTSLNARERIGKKEYGLIIIFIIFSHIWVDCTVF